MAFGIFRTITLECRFSGVCDTLDNTLQHQWYDLQYSTFPVEKLTKSTIHIGIHLGTLVLSDEYPIS